jgi:N-acetylglucosamine malate deacetylase 1
VSLFDETLKLIEPDRIYTHWIRDSHQEHRIVCQAAISASRLNKCSVYMFEPIIPGGIVPYSFRKQVYVNLLDVHVKLKLESIQFHKSQIVKYPGLIEAIESRTKLRGFEIGTPFAETFELVKEIDSFEDLKRHDKFIGDQD